MKKTIRALLAAVLLVACVLAWSCDASVGQIIRDPIPGPDDEVLSEEEAEMRAAAGIPEEVPESEAGHVADRTGSASGTPVTVGGTRYVPRSNIVNILLIGVDNDSTRSGVGRSDMLILCTLDMDTGGISFLTIPRDTHAYVYHISEDGQIMDRVYEKINHAYAYGLGADRYSPQNTMACVSRLLSSDGELEVPIHYYISMDLDGLAELADVFGGVSVTLDQDVPNVGSAGETVNLQGPVVRYYLENRHDMSDGEVSRQIHQQTFLRALMQAVKDRGAVQSAPDLFSVFSRFIKTNLSLRQFLACAKLLDGLSVDEVTFDRISGEGVTVDGVWYLEPDVQQMRELVLRSQYVPG